MENSEIVNANHSPSSPVAATSFFLFLDDFKARMKSAFHEKDNIDRLCSKRGMPPAVLQEIMSCNPLSLCIPAQYGGQGGGINENIAFLSAASYESLPLSLTLGINNALFLQPVAKYGQDAAKSKVFKRFLNDRCMGGLMITEPDFGSDALSMQTSCHYQNGMYHIEGTKHWAGLTGMADYWLLTARKRTEGGSLNRDIDFFICDVNSPQQKIEVKEYFESLGLYQIPYGRNHIDVHIPEEQRLVPHSTGIHMMLDILHRSRLQFPGMGMGFIKRMLDEAINHCKARLVRNKSLFDYDQVQQRLSRLQANFTICSAFCRKAGELADIGNDLTQLGLEANVIKSVTSDLMQESSQSLLQLMGAKGYQLNHIAGRSVVDSRSFQIFEGSNDILYAQISEAFLKLMKSAKETSMFHFLKGYAERAADWLNEMVNFEVNMQLPQRKLVELGQVISRIVSMEFVIQLGEQGFRADLVDGALSILKQEISGLLGVFHFEVATKVVVEYEYNSSWLKFTPGVMSIIK